MLKIRLTRMGKKHQPSYRIVVTPKENPARGQYTDLLGTYNPIAEQLDVNKEKAMEWLNKGAQPSERVARLLTKSGMTHRSLVVKVYQPKPKEEPKAEEATPATKAETDEEVGAETEATTETTENSTEAPTEEAPAVEETPESTESNDTEEKPADSAQ